MRSEKVYTIEEIISASKQRLEYKATGDISKRLSFHTKMNTHLEYEDIPKIERVIGYIEKKYHVKLKIVGGGYGCTKINFKVENNSEALDLAKKLLKDEEFILLAKDIDLDVIVVPDENLTFKVVDLVEKKVKPEEDSDGGRVSADGTIQKTGNE